MCLEGPQNYVRASLKSVEINQELEYSGVLDNKLLTLSLQNSICNIFLLGIIDLFPHREETNNKTNTILTATSLICTRR